MENTDYIDKKVNEILVSLGCKSVDEALEKLDKMMSAAHSQSQMHSAAFDKNQTEA